MRIEQLVDSNCYLDTRASSHLTSNPSSISDFSNLSPVNSIFINNGFTIPICGSGTSKITFPTRTLHIPNILLLDILLKLCQFFGLLAKEDQTSFERRSIFLHHKKNLPKALKCLKTDSLEAEYSVILEHFWIILSGSRSTINIIMNTRDGLAIGSDTRPSVLHVHEEEYDEEMNAIKKALALITKSMSKRNTRKLMSSNNHRYSSGRKHERQPELKIVEQGGRVDYQMPEDNTKPYDKSKEPKKTCFKMQDEGTTLLTDDEAWLRMSSDDEEGDTMCMLTKDLTSDEGREDQLCLMANHGEEEMYSEDGDRDYNDLDSNHSGSSSSEILPDPYTELENQVKGLAFKVSEYDKKIKQANNLTTIAESKLASEHALVVKFNIELAYSKDKVNMLTLANKTLEEKVTSLNANITDLQKRLHEAERVSSENVKKYEFIFAQRTNLFAKIKDMEDKFLKRGQTDQTIHMNQPKEFNYYNPKEGIGYKSPCYLKCAISKTPTMYDMRYMGRGYKIVFMKESDDPEQLKEIEKKEKDRKNKHSIPFNYTPLNNSYATRQIPMSKDYTPSYTEAEMNQEVPILEKIYKDNNTFYEKRIAKLEAELEDERRMSLTEKDLFLSKINELEDALKSKSPLRDNHPTSGTCGNTHHHRHAWNVDALDFRPSRPLSSPLRHVSTSGIFMICYYDSGCLAQLFGSSWLPRHSSSSVQQLYVLSKSKYKYYLVLMDNFTQFVWGYPLKTKFETLRNFTPLFKRNLNLTIMILINLLLTMVIFSVFVAHKPLLKMESEAHDSTLK
ncbi:hypothetical protein OSB04_027946 [Centaurea solstitialis]|uniref:Uncharacterized protein n=1 Tax=Centaurea solstitialis TaxID=347529 RepID=A0AA38SES7_9ASTR|nr:hypothetical protein OSB04_027946 [Centaurea solstitialis]